MDLAWWRGSGTVLPQIWARWGELLARCGFGGADGPIWRSWFRHGFGLHVARILQGFGLVWLARAFEICADCGGLIRQRNWRGFGVARLWRPGSGKFGMVSACIRVGDAAELVCVDLLRISGGRFCWGLLLAWIGANVARMWLS